MEKGVEKTILLLTSGLWLLILGMSSLQVTNRSMNFQSVEPSAVLKPATPELGLKNRLPGVSWPMPVEDSQEAEDGEDDDSPEDFSVPHSPEPFETNPLKIGGSIWAKSARGFIAELHDPPDEI